MKIASVTLKGVTPMSQGRYHNEPKKSRESHEDYETRTWKKRLHTDKDGNVLLTPFMLKNCLVNGTKYKSMKVKGMGNKTYTGFVKSGVYTEDWVTLNVKEKDIQGETRLVPANGQTGGPTRVMRTFPIIPAGWEGTAKFQVLDDTVTKEVFEHFLKQAGKYVGLGSFRVENNGIFGRFDVKNIDWEEIDEGVELF